MAGKPQYVYSARWDRVLRTDNSPPGYGRGLGPAGPLHLRVQRGAKPVVNTNGAE